MLNNVNNNQYSLLNNLHLQQKMQDRQVFEQFMHKDEHVTCDQPKGRLVKENVLKQFAATFTDTAKDAKNLGRALAKGDSNDFELGRMNDLGMKLGGGLIAAALIGSRSTTSKKLMELAGFGTFFSVMSLWPKAAIDAPTKLLHGFNPHQKYIDSQGRKKLFFQDNQYLPWDVWSKEDINKVADKMGISKDLKDREEYTKEKMRTIALQDNTLWMLTAGLATPLITSLACNRIEEALKVPVANKELTSLLNQVNGEKAENLLRTTIADANVFAKQDEAFAQIIKQLKDGEKPEDLAKKLGEIFDLTRFADNKTISGNVRRSGASIANDLVATLFPQGEGFLTNGFVEKLAGSETGDIETIRNILAQAHSQALADPALQGKVTLSDVIDNAGGIIRQNAGEYRGKKWANVIVKGTENFDDELRNLANTRAGYDKATLEQGAKTLETVYNESIKPVQAQMRIFGKQLGILDGISGEKYNRSAKAVVKALGLTDREIRVLRSTDETAGKLLRETLERKISEVAQDDAKYNKLIGILQKEQQRIEEASTKNGKTSIAKVFEEMTGKVSQTMKRCAGILNSEGNGSLDNSQLKQILNSGLSESEIAGTKTNITSVNSMITKMFNALELERKIGDGTLLENWTNYAKQNGLIQEGAEALSEAELQDFYKVCRKIAWQSSYGDAMNKFYAEGNGGFYKSLMNTIFSSDASTEAITDWRQAVKHIASTTEYIPNESLVVSCQEGLQEAVKPHSQKFADFGESVLNTFKKQIDQLYNDRKWLKTFGGITLALVGVTVASQFFFGKVKNAHLYQEKQGSQDTFESGK